MDDQNNSNTPNPEETVVTPEPTAVNGKVSDLLNLESLVKRYVNDINLAKETLKTQKEMFDSAFLNDETYREHDRLSKEANKVKNGTKQQIMRQPSVALLDEKIKDLRFQLQELQVSLSDYLSQYQKLTGATQIEMEDGQILEIVNNLKLVKKSPEYRP